MRILWYSSAPWEPTGYGTQTGIWCKRMQAAGHDVAVSAYHGVHALKVTWDGIPVFPAALYGTKMGGVLGQHIREWQPDLVIALCDIWYHGEAFTQLADFPDVRLAAWVPTDTDRLAVGDRGFLLEMGKRVGLKAIAMSRAGQASMSAAGIESVYAPHGIDCFSFVPPSREHRQALRAELGLDPGTFAVGWNFNNGDPYRKGQYEGLRAFAQFHGKHPDSRLFLHTVTPMDGSKYLDLIVDAEGITDAVRLSDQTRMLEGSFSQEEMIAWYGSMDVVLNASLGEGFGLTSVEAQACGTPVILSDGTTGPELKGAGWLCATQPWWNDRHAARWHLPLIRSLEECLRKAHHAMGDEDRRGRARSFAEQYDVESVWPLWQDALDTLME